jgi:ligand-binding sensor domain-containing protein
VKIIKLTKAKILHVRTNINKRLLIELVFLLIVTRINAQTKLEAWRDHLPFTDAFQVLDADTRIYCATPGGLFYFDKSDNTINKFTRIQGLSDNGISAISYSKTLKQLLIGYTDGNLDIVENNSITNISDIKVKSNLGDKKINHILLINSNAYISCAFGIVLFNLNKKEITDTYYFPANNGTNLEVFAVALDDQFIYAATAEGIRKASQSDPNLFNFTSWSKITDIPNSDKKFSKIIYTAPSIIALCSTYDPSFADKAYYNQGSVWLEMNSFTYDHNYYSIESSQGQIIIAGYNNCFVFDNNLNKISTLYNGSPRYAIIDKDNIIWIADPLKGMVRFTLPNTSEVFLPNGPISKKTYSVQAVKNEVLVLGGGTNGSWDNRFFSGEFSFFKDQSWMDTLVTSIWDPLNAVFDPANPNHIYIATWGYGILELMNHQIVRIYNEKNSSLQNIPAGLNYVRIGGLAFDKDHNLWATNSEVPNRISVLKANGEWKGLPYEDKIKPNTVMGKILITRSNIKWVILPHGGGLFAFDDRGTLDNANDDLTRKFAVSDLNGGSISSFVYSFAEDLDGNLWVGTSSGPAVYYNPDGVFSGDNFYAYQVRIPRNDGTPNADLLLSTETITAIAIDGANRKWFGTQNSGIYLMSADGLKQIYHFTSTNSPLLSNSITDIAIDPASGEVFMGTDQGLVSFRSTATLGLDDFGKVYVFPDPVRPDFHGNIVISGLIRDANVKITDISGNLVYETTSLGGQALWNGNNLDGKRAATGVYLVFCTNEDGSKTFVTKLLFIH